MDIAAKTYVIPNEVCRRAGVAASWLPVNQLGLFPYNHLTAKGPDKPSLYAPCDSTVQQIRQEVILFEPVLRKLINEANGAFLGLQQKTTQEQIDLRKEVHKFSRQYRSIIRACLENLQEDTTNQSVEHQELVSNYITIFYSVECVWHLCEILFVDLIPGNCLLPYLLEWIRFHFPKHERNAAILLSGDLTEAETHPDYWDTVVGNLMQGRIDIARGLLKMHSAADSTPFKLVDVSLKSMPIYNVYGGMSVTEFNLKWRHWQNDAQSKIDAKLFISDKNLDLIMRLTVGEEQAWEQVRPKSEAWYELLACWLFFTEPTVKSFELGNFARRWLNRCGGKDQMKHLDSVILAALEFDLLEVIKEIQFMSENGWFVAHLTDLLYHCGRLDALDKQEGNKVASYLRESFLLDYGTILMEHKSLWQVGLSYFDHCPNEGIHRAEILLERLPLDTEARTFKIIREAEKRNLMNVVSSICKIRGMMSLKTDRLGNALTWALRSQDGSFTSYLADRFLQEYSKNGQLKNIDLLDNLGSCMLVSDKLIFLGKYCEFHKVYKSGEFKNAAELLISLLASKITPKYFWVTLLTDALPLLECENLVMSSNDTLTLLHCLEERLTTPGLDDKVPLIRLAIARNLARALTHEAQAA